MRSRSEASGQVAAVRMSLRMFGFVSDAGPAWQPYPVATSSPPLSQHRVEVVCRGDAAKLALASGLDVCVAVCLQLLVFEVSGVEGLPLFGAVAACHANDWAFGLGRIVAECFLHTHRVEELFYMRQVSPPGVESAGRARLDAGLSAS